MHDWNATDSCLNYSNLLMLSDAYMRHQTRPSLVQILVCSLFSTKPSPETMMAYYQLYPWEHYCENWIKIQQLYWGKWISKYRLQTAAILSRLKCLNLTGLTTPRVEHCPSKYQSFIYNTRYLMSPVVRSRKGSKLWNLCLELSNRCENWQVSRWLCCGDVWQILKQYDK